MTDRQQRSWTVAEVEHWMDFGQGQIDLSDRVVWRYPDGDLSDMSVRSYVRARKKWAPRPTEWLPQS